MISIISGNIDYNWKDKIQKCIEDFEGTLLQSNQLTITSKQVDKPKTKAKLSRPTNKSRKKQTSK